LLTASPKVTDFGLARRLDAESVHTQSGAVVGTPSYMAPEQAQGQRDIGPTADVYALGAILYELLTGRPPFRAETPLETLLQVIGDDPVPPRLLLPRLPRDVETICLKCLQKEPARRYARASDLGDDLTRFLAGDPIRARPVGRGERLVRWCRRNPLMAAMTVALVVVLMAGFAGVTSFWMMARHERDRAERNFERVFQAIDESLTQVSGSPELKAKELRPFRKRLYAAAQEQYQGFVAELGDNPRAEVALFRSWVRLGQINRELGLRAEAEEAARTSVALGEKLVAKAPTAENRFLLSWAWEEQMLATVEAAAQWRAIQHTLELLEVVVRDDPANLAALAALARACYNAGVFCDDAKDTKEALVWISKARDLLEREAAGPQPVRSQELLAQVLLHMARLQAGPLVRRNAQALESCQRAIDLYARLAREYPDERRRAVDLAGAFLEQNLIQSQAGRPATECIASLRRGGSVLEELLAAGVPSGDVRAQVQIQRAMIGHNLSLTYLENGQAAEALAVMQQTRELSDKLLLTYPDNSELHYWLAVSCTNLAALHQKEGKLAEVLGLLEQARPSMEYTVRVFPDLARRSELGYLLQSLGTEYHRLGQPEKAVQFLREAIEQQRRVCAREPKSAAYRHALAEHYLALAEIQRSRNRVSEAVAAALEAGKRYHDSPAQLYQVAVELARSMNRVGEGRGPLSPEQQAERQRYARHTLEALKAAVAAGYRDGAALRKEPAFAPLRAADEFQKLLQEVE
jgi:tetratricopeptide (TPR) repeat protein